MAKVYLQDIELAKASDVSTKQDTLVSGDNIKTINGQSLLGSGDMEIDVPEDVMKTKGHNNVSDDFWIVSSNEDMSENSVIMVNDIEIALRHNVSLKYIETVFGADGFLLSSWDEDSDDPHPLPIKINSEGAIYISSPHTSIVGLTDPQSPKEAAHKQYVDNTVATKQDNLVSGTNIKTINNQSLLGSGNIDIESSTVEYATTAEAMAVVQEVINARS